MPAGSETGSSSLSAGSVVNLCWRNLFLICHRPQIFFAGAVPPPSGLLPFLPMMFLFSTLHCPFLDLGCAFPSGAHQ